MNLATLRTPQTQHNQTFQNPDRVSETKPAAVGDELMVVSSEAMMSSAAGTFVFLDLI